MPIYDYRCNVCGFEKEYLQKLSDPPVTVCPSCGRDTFVKKLTAAGFQLRGSGWYATDFKNPQPSKQAKADSKTEKEGTASAADKESTAETAGKSDAASGESKASSSDKGGDSAKGGEAGQGSDAGKGPSKAGASAKESKSEAKSDRPSAPTPGS